MATGAATQNDRLAAIQEFREAYNVSPNAEDLLMQQQFSLSAAVREAALLPIDHNATADLDLDELAGLTTVSGTKVSDMGKIRAAAVRGGAISVVIETADGRLVKDVVPGSDDYVAPREPAHLAALRARTQTEADHAAELAALRDDFAAQMADLRAEMAQTLGAKQAEVEQKAAEAGEAAAAEAEEAAEEATQTGSGNAGSGTGDSSEERGGKSQAKPAAKKPAARKSGAKK